MKTTLFEYRVSRDSSQVQAVFEFFEVKTQNFGAYFGAILPNLMQSKQDFTESIFRSVSNNNLLT